MHIYKLMHIEPPHVATKVFSIRFWMQLHGSPTPKPTMVYSCMGEIESLDLGKLTKEEKERRTQKELVRYLLDQYTNL